jgi:hypothetical protein
MDFKEATDGLFEGISHADLAEELGVSVASIRQARLPQTANSHRAPPKNWEFAAIRLAERQMMKCRKLIEQIRKGN